MEWSEFAQRLGRELAGLDRDTILIIRERAESRHYVQAMREPDRLYAEAVSNFFLEGPLLLTAADEEVLRETGWKPPGDPVPRNWWTELPSFATVADHFRLADMMVHALRDVQGVRRPSDLVHESFHRLQSGLIELVGLGIDPADPSRVTERRSTPDPASFAQPAAGAPMSALAPFTPPPPAAVNGTARGVPRHPAPLPAPPALSGADPGASQEPDDGELESRLTEAKQQGDHVTYFDLLLRSDLVLPLAEEPGESEPVTTTIAGITYVVVFSSPGALRAARSPQSATPPPHRLVPFGTLAATWPDPSWSLAVNAGLPSEVLLDSAAVARLHQTRVAQQTASAEGTGPQRTPPADGAAPAGAVPGDRAEPSPSPAAAVPGDHAVPSRHAAPDGHTPPPGRLGGTGPHSVVPAAPPHQAAPGDHTAPGPLTPGAPALPSQPSVPDGHAASPRPATSTGPQAVSSDDRTAPVPADPGKGTGPQSLSAAGHATAPLPPGPNEPTDPARDVPPADATAAPPLSGVRPHPSGPALGIPTAGQGTPPEAAGPVSTPAPRGEAVPAPLAAPVDPLKATSVPASPQPDREPAAPSDLPRRHRKRVDVPPAGEGAGAASGEPVAIRLPQGVQMWEDPGDGAPPRPLAVYDVTDGGWRRLRVEVSGESEQDGR